MVVFVAIFLSLAAFTLISLDPLPFSIPSKYTREKDKEKKIEEKKFHYTLVTDLYKFIFHLHSNAVSNFHSNWAWWHRKPTTYLICCDKSCLLSLWACFLFTMTRGFEDAFHLPLIQDPSVFLLLNGVTFWHVKWSPKIYFSEVDIGHLCNHVPFCLLFA